jgi:hypothetical protein
MTHKAMVELTSLGKVDDGCTHQGTKDTTLFKLALSGHGLSGKKNLRC